MNCKGTNRTSWDLVLSLCKKWSFCNESVCHILSAVIHAECYAILHSPKKLWDMSMVQLSMSKGDSTYSRKIGQLSCWGYPYFWKSG